MSDAPNIRPAEMYERYFVPGIHARWTPLLLEHAGVRAGDRVLDVACGTGVVARNVAPLVGAEGSVTAVDVDPEMLDVARSVEAPEGAAVAWREGDATSLPVPNGAFDAVVCQQGLQFVSDRPAAAREMARALAPGGRAAASVWQDLEHHAVYEALCEAEARYLGIPVEAVATPFTMGDASELEAAFDAAGFRTVEVRRATREVRFPSPDTFVALTLLAAASIVPESEMNAADREALVAAVSREVDHVVDRHSDGDAITFPMHAHIVVARA